MANAKISALTSATTPLAGTEVLPIVQTSTTKKVAVSDLTAGREVSATKFSPTGTSVTGNGLYLPATNSVGISTNGSNALYIDSAQKIGVGTSSPQKKLVVSNGGAAGLEIDPATRSGTTGASLLAYNRTTSAFVRLDYDALEQYFFISGSSVGLWDTNGYLLIGYATSNGAYRLQVNSQIFATNATIATSDGKYKENIVNIDDALSTVMKLRPVQFSWKNHPIHNFDTSSPTIGFIAQEVQEALNDKPYLPSIVKSNHCTIEPPTVNEDGTIVKEAVKEEFLGMGDSQLIALLTKSIQELKAQIDELRAIIQEQGK